MRFGRSKQPDPLLAAVHTTITDLLKVSTEIKENNAKLMQRVEHVKRNGAQSDRP